MPQEYEVIGEVKKPQEWEVVGDAPKRDFAAEKAEARAQGKAAERALFATDLVGNAVNAMVWPLSVPRTAQELVGLTGLPTGPKVPLPTEIAEPEHPANIPFVSGETISKNLRSTLRPPVVEGFKGKTVKDILFPQGEDKTLGRQVKNYLRLFGFPIAYSPEEQGVPPEYAEFINKQPLDNKLLEGMVSEVGNVAASLTTPQNLGLLPLAPAMAAKGATGEALKTAAKIVFGTIGSELAGEGAKDIYEGIEEGDKEKIGRGIVKAPVGGTMIAPSFLRSKNVIPEHRGIEIQDLRTPEERAPQREAIAPQTPSKPQDVVGETFQKEQGAVERSQFEKRIRDSVTKEVNIEAGKLAEAGKAMTPEQIAESIEARTQEKLRKAYTEEGPVPSKEQEAVKLEEVSRQRLQERMAEEEAARQARIKAKRIEPRTKVFEETQVIPEAPPIERPAIAPRPVEGLFEQGPPKPVEAAKSSYEAAQPKAEEISTRPVEGQINLGNVSPETLRAAERVQREQTVKSPIQEAPVVREPIAGKRPSQAMDIPVIGEAAPIGKEIVRPTAAPVIAQRPDMMRETPTKYAERFPGQEASPTVEVPTVVKKPSKPTKKLESAAEKAKKGTTLYSDITGGVFTVSKEKIKEILNKPFVPLRDIKDKKPKFKDSFAEDDYNAAREFIERTEQNLGEAIYSGEIFDKINKIEKEFRAAISKAKHPERIKEAADFYVKEMYEQGPESADSISWLNEAVERYKDDSVPGLRSSEFRMILERAGNEIWQHSAHNPVTFDRWTRLGKEIVKDIIEGNEKGVDWLQHLEEKDFLSPLREKDLINSLREAYNRIITAHGERPQGRGTFYSDITGGIASAGKEAIEKFLKGEASPFGLRAVAMLNQPRETLKILPDSKGMYNGHQLVGRYKNVLNPLEQELLSEAFKEIEKKPKISAEEVKKIIDEKGAKVEVHAYGMEGKVSEAKREYDKMTHEWLDSMSMPRKQEFYDASEESGTLRPTGKINENYLYDRGWRTEDVEKAKQLEILRQKVANEPRDNSPRATSAYANEEVGGSGVAALSSEEPMPEWTTSKEGKNVQRVDVVIPTGNRKGIAATVDRESKTLWTPDPFHENLPNTLGWAMIQYKTGAKGEKIAVVVEAQSRWEQTKRANEPIEIKKDPQGGETEYLIYARDKDRKPYEISASSPEKAMEYAQAEWHRDYADHPLLRDYNRLILKAAIEQARKEGATHIMVSDAETAMMTEGHDIMHAGDAHGSFETPELAKKWSEKYASDNKLNPDTMKVVGVNQADGQTRYYIHELTQEPGMRLNYDTILPKIMEELTGQKGEKVSLGEHKNAFEQKKVSDQFNNQREIIMQRVMDGELTPAQAKRLLDPEASQPRENLIFKNPDGTPKTDVSGLMYDISKAVETIEKRGGMSLGGKKLYSDPFGIQSMAHLFRLATSVAKKPTGLIVAPNGRELKISLVGENQYKFFGADIKDYKIDGKAASADALYTGEQLQKAGFKKFESVPAQEQIREARPDETSGGQTLLFSDITGGIASKAFKDWFGGSKVVDKDGKPLVVYHGTAAPEFTKFNTTGYNARGYTYGEGAYFTPDKERASGYSNVSLREADRAIDKGTESAYYETKAMYPSRIYPTYIALKKPFRTNSDATVNDIGNNLYKNNLQEYKKLAEEIKTKNGYSDWQSVSPTEVGNLKLRKDGYDGIIKDWGTESKPNIIEVVAFYPEQIKSIHNKGTWSPDNPDILYSNPIPQLAKRLIDKFVTRVSGTTERIAKLHGDEGAYIAPKLNDVAAERVHLYGRYVNAMVGEAEKLLKGPTEKFTGVSKSLDEAFRYMNEMYDNGRSSIKLTPEQKTFVDNIRKILVQMHDDQRADGPLIEGVRNPKDNPNWVFQRMSNKVIDTLVNKPTSTEAGRLRLDFIEYRKKQGVSEEAAKTEFREMFPAATSQKRTQTFFGSLRKAEGQGIPPSWRENNFIEAATSYGQRFATDLAFYRNIQKDPIARAILNISDDGRGGTSVAKELNGHDIARLDTTGDIQSIMTELTGNFTREDATVQAVNRAVKAGWLQTGTGLRDVALSPFIAMESIKPSEVPLMLRAIKEISNGYAHGAKEGVVRKRKVAIQELWRDSNTIADKLDTLWTNPVNKLTGRETLEGISRSFTMQLGRLVAESRHLKGDTSFFEEFGPKDWQQKIKTPEGLAETIDWAAARFVESKQGTYDYRGVPSFVREGPLSPITSLAKWNVERFNNFRKHVIKPLKEGNPTPLLMSLLGGMIGAAAVAEINKLLNRKKPSHLTWSEWFGLDDVDSDETMFLLAATADYAGYAGIVSTIARDAMAATHGVQPHGFTFPFAEGVRNVVNQISDFAEAKSQGSDVKIGQLAMALARDQIQDARIIENWLKPEEEIKEKEMRRNLNVFERVEYNKTSPSFEPNEFLNADIKEFKSTTDVNKLIELAPQIVQRYKELYKDPQVLEGKINGLKQNPQQIMPSEELDFRRQEYENWLKRTSGEKAVKNVKEAEQMKKVLGALRDAFIDYAQRGEQIPIGTSTIIPENKNKYITIP